MFTTNQYRAKSAGYDKLSKGSTDPGQQIRKNEDLSDSSKSLADNEEWLAANFDKTLRASTEKHSSYVGLAAKAEHAQYLRPRGKSRT